MNCTPAADASFADDGTCVPPSLEPCPFPDFGKLASTYSLSFHGATPSYPVHGDSIEIACANDTAPVDIEYSNETWGQKSYRGRRALVAMCNNGTWTHMLYPEDGHLQPDGLRCFNRKRIDLLKEVDHYVRWTQARLREAEDAHFKWVDDNALQRKVALMNMQTLAWQVLAEAANGTVATADKLGQLVEGLKSYSIISRGKPFGPESCGNLQTHFTAVGFNCSYTVEKTATGRDPWTWQTKYVYRDGCYCESEWTGLCPYRLELVPNFKQFGFHSLEEKEITHESGPGTKALCWYWSDSLHPEWGFMRL